MFIFCLNSNDVIVMAVKVKLRKWGNSMGALFPKSFIESEGLKENDEILLERIREADLSDVFGSLKGNKMTGQQFKDMVRKGGGNG